MRRGRRAGTLLRELVFELVVVFVGVYAAFALTEWQAQRAADERRDQIQEALVREIRDITTNTRRASVEASALAAVYDSAVAAGEPLLPTPMIEPIRVRAHMWESTLASDGLELLDVATVYQLSDFYNRLNAGFELLAQLRSLSETMIIPNLGAGVSAFYDESGFRPEYQWYITRLHYLADVAGEITDMGDAIVLELGEDLPSSP